MLLTAILGLWAGVVHAGSGPDHLAGVAPFAARAKERPWRVGVLWGLGHACGAGAAAALALVLRSEIPGLEEVLSLWSERIVGVILCVVGALGLSGLLRRRMHTHEAPRGALALGFLHGAAGLSHLFAVLPALALPGVAEPAAYLGGYAVGSLALVALFASGLSLSRRWLGDLRLERVASVASLVVGVWWLATS
jgi:hypothetical protein